MVTCLEVLLSRFLNSWPVFHPKLPCTILVSWDDSGYSKIKIYFPLTTALTLFKEVSEITCLSTTSHIHAISLLGDPAALITIHSFFFHSEDFIVLRYRTFLLIVTFYVVYSFLLQFLFHFHFQNFFHGSIALCNSVIFLPYRWTTSITSNTCLYSVVFFLFLWFTFQLPCVTV